jgi:hypothetical protein
VEIVSEKIGIKMLSSSNVLVSLSEIEVCLIIAGLYTVKGKQVDESYKKTIQNLIDKVSKQTPLDNR